MDFLRRGLLYQLAALFVVVAFAAITPLVGRADDEPPPPKRQLTPQELLRKRIAESLAGVRTNAAPQSTTLKEPDLTDREKVVQVLNRLSYGPTPGEVDQVLEAGGWEKWVKQQLEPDKIDDSACDHIIAQRFPWTGKDIHQLKAEFGGYDNRSRLREIHEQLPESVITRSVLSKRQFKEVMCDFWRNHFCVDQPQTDEKSRSWTDADYEQTVIRRFAFGKFGDMLFASAHHPAMLEYLDNWLSKANNWNENYARELMELHTLGADRGYGNLDVQELSKVLTGWTYDKNYNFIFQADEHQPGPKHWLGRTLPEGYKGGTEAIYILATHPNTANFISEKLCRYLVNDNPPPALVRQVATVFRETQGDLPKVYWAIISSKEFMSRDNFRCKFKTPFQFCVSALRTTGAKVEDTHQVAQTLERMGEAMYNCADPTGYRDQAESWMDAGVLTTRWQFSWDIARGGNSAITIPDSFFDRYKSLKTEEMEQKMIEDLIGGDCGDRELVALKDAASNGDVPRMTSILLGSPSFQQR